MNRIIAGIVLCWLAGIAGARAAGNGAENGLAFLKIGVDARSAGMGEAYTAVANDAFATYWNPAGLLSASRTNAGFMHNSWLMDVNSEFGALQFRTPGAALAFHVNTLNVGDIEVRAGPSADPLETTSAHYVAAGISYARPLSENLAAGFTVKYLYEKIFVESAGGYALDVGVTYSGVSENLILAGVVQNAGKMNELRDEATRLPLSVRGGAAYTGLRLPADIPILVAADVVQVFRESARFHVGAEGGLWREQILLRAGYAFGYESRSVSAGIGIRKSAFRLDYSFTPFQDDLGNGHRFSIAFEL